MQISYERALEAFGHLEGSRQLPTLSPTYVVIDAERNEELEPFFWLYEEGNKLVYQGGHLASIPGTQFRDIQTAYQYGGPVSNTHDSAFLLRAWQAYTQWCRENSIAVEFVRFHPLLHNWDLFPGEAVFNRMAVWVDLTCTDLMASYQTRVRTAVRKAVKNGLRVEWRTGPDNADWFAEFYYSTMRKIGAEQFYFFSQSYFRQLLEWEQARLAVCMRGYEQVAAAIFLVGPEVTEYHLSASSHAGKHLGGTNLLLHEAAQTAQSEGCRALYLGGGTDSEPANPLLFFKTGFSTKHAEFRIGRHVHSDEGYISLREQFSEAYEAHPGRVLFYR
jgi:hypothetical protein